MWGFYFLIFIYSLKIFSGYVELLQKKLPERRKALGKCKRKFSLVENITLPLTICFSLLKSYIGSMTCLPQVLLTEQWIL